MTHFKDLLSIKLSHSYYSGSFADLSVVVSEGSQAATRGGRVIAKPVGGSLRVLYEAGNGDNPIISLAGTSLRFGLLLQNAHFPNFTSIPQHPATLAVYRNWAAKNKLDDPLSALPATSITTHPLSRVARPVTVQLKNADGSVIGESTMTNGDIRTAAELDFRTLAPGLYTVEEGYPSPPVKKITNYFLEPGLPQTQLFGIVDVKIDATFYSAPPSFDISFTARHETLRYYLVTQGYTPAEINKLKVTDIGFNAAGRPEIKFEKMSAASFTPSEIPAAVLTAGGGKVVAFRSKDPVARRKGGHQRIQLSNNGDVLIANLPQPGPQQPASDLVVNLSKKT